MDVIEINPSSVEINDLSIPDFKLSDNFDNDDALPSSNFGGGIELLMNDKKGEKKNSSNINLDDISKLEDELNELTNKEDVKLDFKNVETIKPSLSDNNENNGNKPENTNKRTIFGGLFGGNKDGKNIRSVTENNDAKNLGESTSQLNDNKTWD